MLGKPLPLGLPPLPLAVGEADVEAVAAPAVADPSRVGATDTDAEPLGGGVGAEEALSRGDGVPAALSKTPEGEAEAVPSAGRAP